MPKDLLLISNSKVAGGPLLEHAREEMAHILAGVKEVTFIPYGQPGGITPEEYFAIMKPVFDEIGHPLRLVDHEYPVPDIRKSEAFYVGGGNTNHLLSVLEEHRLLPGLSEVVEGGVPYIGCSAGSNIAGMTISGTNDKRAVDCGLSALELVPFNINPHYRDERIEATPEQVEQVLAIIPQLAPILRYQGETREDQLNEIHAFGNPEDIVALREGAMLRVTDDRVYLKGTSGAKLFRLGEEPREYSPGASLDFLMQGA